MVCVVSALCCYEQLAANLTHDLDGFCQPVASAVITDPQPQKPLQISLLDRRESFRDDRLIKKKAGLFSPPLVFFVVCPAHASPAIRAVRAAVFAAGAEAVALIAAAEDVRPRGDVLPGRCFQSRLLRLVQPRLRCSGCQ